MAKIFYVESKHIGCDDDALDKLINTINQGDDAMITELTGKLTRYANGTGGTSLSIRRGDMFTILPGSRRYRNDFVFIYDGSVVMPLDGSIIDYGTIPPQFEINDHEFAVGWWNNVMEHNNIFYISKDIIKRFHFIEEREGLWTSKIKLRAVCDEGVQLKDFICIIDSDSSENIEAFISGHENLDVMFELEPVILSLDELEYVDDPAIRYKFHDLPVIFLQFLNQ